MIMEKLSNDQILKNIKVRKILKVLLIIFSILTITLSVLSLLINLNPIFAVISFIIEVILNKKRDSYKIK